MTKIVIWCRHINDNIIGIDGVTPWHVQSDLQRFKKITQDQNVVCGRITYENLPDRNLPGRKIFVFTKNKNYQLSDEQNHKVISNIAEFIDFPEDLYIIGGAQIYQLFMDKLPPEVIIDCVYNGEINVTGNKTVHISNVIEFMNKKYKRLLPPIEKDNVSISIWLKKSEFVEQKTLRHILETYLSC